MKGYRHFLLVIFLGAGLFAAQPPSYADPLEREAWEERTRKVDYTDKPIEESKAVTQISRGITADGLRWFSYGIITLVVLLLLFLLIRNLRSVPRQPANPEVRKGAATATDDELMEQPLDELLRKALREGEYRLAVRLGFLMLLQDFRNKNFITWKREKTNSDYAREVGDLRSGDFRRAALYFEKVWYGSTAISEPVVKGILEYFEQLKQEGKPEKRVLNE